MKNANSLTKGQPFEEGGAVPAFVLILISTAAAVALFFFFTAGIPLIQAGLLADFGEGKKRYVKAARLSVLLLGTGLMLLRWKCPRIFDRLWLVRAARRTLSFPLGTNIAVLFFIYGLTLSAVSVLRHAALETRAFDLGIFAQAVWTTLHGSFLYSSIKEGICLMGDHVSPLLALLTAPYAVWPDPRTLLILQAFAAAACLFPLAQFVEEKFLDKKTALVFALMYFFFMPTRAAVHEDFHPEVLVEPLMIWAFLWLERGRMKLFLLALAVILAAKENMSGIVFAFGVYAGVFKKKRLLGLALAVFSVAYLFFCTRWLVPHLSGKPYLYTGFYSHLAGADAAGLMGMLADPERWEYLLKVYLPFLYLPFLDPPTLLLTLPVLVQNLLSRNGVARSFNYHYMTGLTPFLFISSAAALLHLRTRFAGVRKHFDIFLAVLLWTAMLRAGAPEYFYGWESARHITARTAMIRSEMAKIPGTAVLLTHNNLVPQAVNRFGVYQFDYAPLPAKAQAAVKRKAGYVAMDARFWEPDTPPLESEKRALLAGGYRVIFEKDDFLILQK